MTSTPTQRDWVEVSSMALIGFPKRRRRPSSGRHTHHQGEGFDGFNAKANPPLPTLWLDLP